jgi:uracil-DNA glycosylase
MRAILVGEAWGRREAMMQHALVGMTGIELSLWMGQTNFAPYLEMQCHNCKRTTPVINFVCRNCRNRVWPNEFDLINHWKRLRSNHSIAVTNVFNTQPPNNDLGYFFGHEKETEMVSWKASRKSGGSHLKSEHFHHVKRLWNELINLKPTLIVCMGNAACWAILNQTLITTLRGTVNWSERLGVKCLPTFHPAAILRNPVMRVACLRDFEKAAREIEFPEIRRPERYLTILAPTKESLAEGWNWLKRPASTYAADIETVRRQISVIGFARSASDALVIPIRDGRNEKGKIVDIGKIATNLGYQSNSLNYWPDSTLEFEAWQIAISGLRSNKEKVFQNGLFDMFHLGQIGIFPKNVKHDTMLWHHSEYPELPKSLGFLGSIYANEIAWKQMSRFSSLKRDE